MKRALITGATGFVGSNLCRKLVKENWKVFIISRKTSDYSNLIDIKEKITILEYSGEINSLIKWMQEIKVDVVFHLASFIKTEHQTEDLNKLLSSNIIFGSELLEAMKKSKTNKLINTGTYWQHYNEEDYNPVDLYSATKEAFEKIIEYYAQAEEIQAITLELFDTYGENDKRPKLINLLNKFSKEQTELKMSKGEQMLDLVHVDDVVNSFVKAFEYLEINKKIKHKKYGVSSGKQISLKKLIVTYEKLTGNKINVIWGGREYRKREVMKPWGGFKKLPNYKVKILLEEKLGGK